MIPGAPQDLLAVLYGPHTTYTHTYIHSSSVGLHLVVSLNSYHTVYLYVARVPGSCLLPAPDLWSFIILETKHQASGKRANKILVPCTRPDFEKQLSESWPPPRPPSSCIPHPATHNLTPLHAPISQPSKYPQGMYCCMFACVRVQFILQIACACM